MVAIHAGMRKSEILNLKWEQVDLNHGFVLLDITKNGELKEIPINTTLEYLFQDMLSSKKGAFVFPDERTGKPFGTIKKSFATALEKASILDFRFQDSRHTFASHFVMGGIDLTSVKELLGHKTLTMTMRYAHLSPSHKRRAVNLLDKVLSENGENKKCDNLVTFDQNSNHPKSPKSLKNKVRPEGIEPSTH